MATELPTGPELPTGTEAPTAARTAAARGRPVLSTGRPGRQLHLRAPMRRARLVRIRPRWHPERVTPPKAPPLRVRHGPCGVPPPPEVASPSTARPLPAAPKPSM